MIQGMVLSTMSMLEKEDRGIHTLAGRPAKRTEMEQMILADCALTLALESGNRKLARKLGIAASRLKTALDDLPGNNLPCPALALCNREILESNFNIIDRRFTLQDGAPQRSLIYISLIPLIGVFA